MTTSMPRRILLFGGNGLLGQTLVQALSSEQLTVLDRDSLDVTDQSAVEATCQKIQPEVMINAAAYNAVDEAERNFETGRQAFETNAYAVHRLAKEALKRGCHFIHFSTDYVFNGSKTSPYTEDDEPRPQSVYARSKVEGEEAMLRLSERNLSYYLIRTSRLFGRQHTAGSGKKTFVDIVLEAVRDGRELAFIDDEEVASPTYVRDLAAAVLSMLEQKLPSGIYHRTNDGGCSWYEFARAVLEESGQYSVTPGVPSRHYVTLKVIRAADLERLAKRPCYSVLGSTKLPPLRPWREALRAYLKEPAE